MARAARRVADAQGVSSDVGGTNPLRISFVADGATRDFNSNEVARIYFARPGGGDVSGGRRALRPGTGQIRVPANGGLGVDGHHGVRRASR